MTLPYVRALEYVSPSSLRQFEREPMAFYLQRLGPVEAKPEADPTGWPAIVGSAFDSHIKPVIALRCGLPSRTVLELMGENAQHADYEKAMAEGARLARAYAECGALDALLREKPTGIDYEMDDAVAVGNVPVRGKPDAVLRGAVAHEFKVFGSGTPGQSPTAGYVRLWDSKKPRKPTGPHRKSKVTLEHINVDWATQLVIYGLILGLRGRKVSVDQIVVGHGDQVRVAQFRTTVSAAFVRDVKRRLSACWDAVQAETVVPAELARGGLAFIQASR